jgi:glutathione S-transferase
MAGRTKNAAAGPEDPGSNVVRGAIERAVPGDRPAPRGPGARRLPRSLLSDPEPAMSHYELHYWQVPFRGQFIRAILAFAGERWDEFDDAAVAAAMDEGVHRQPVSFKGPPLLVDKRSGVALAQMPAIAYYLGETLDLLPATTAAKALSLKVVNDANDVIGELTVDGGRQMWTPRRWQEFLPRLRRWMTIFEETGRRHHLSAERGFLLGGTRAGVADIVTATLWGTAGDRLPAIARLLEREAPAVAGLSRRLAAEPALANLARVSRDRFGDRYCGGAIEVSLRRVAG